MLTGAGDRAGRIVVLGMHRSGTSCVAELLAAMGAYFRPAGMTPRGNEQNPHGLFERMDLRRICHFALRSMGGDWWETSRLPTRALPAVARARIADMLPPMLAELDAHEPWFIKEPRLCLLLPMLREPLGSIVAVHVWRDPVEVAESLRTRDAIPMEFGIALWERYVRASFAAGVRGAIVSYNRLVADPVGTTRALLDDLRSLDVRGLRMPDTRELAQVIDASFHRSRAQGARSNVQLSAEQGRLLEALELGDPADPELAAPISAAALGRLAFLEQGRRKQMSAAAFGSLAAASRGRKALRKRAKALSEAVRYMPWNLARWLKWRKHGVLRQRLREHWVASGIAAGGAFDPVWYAQRYADVSRSSADPLMHFVRFGAAEGRDPAPSCSTSAQLHAMLDRGDDTARPGAKA
jgi:hypothetical protein